MVMIFYVQPGYMIPLEDDTVIMGSVGELKEQIMLKSNIPIDKQVLIINGGQFLESNKTVCSYVTGIDSSPIFLFSNDYRAEDVKMHPDYNDTALRQRLAEAIDLPVSLNTVKIRTVIAQDFCNVAKQQLDFCNKLKEQQHLQQQGWSAVIANLEDVMSEFQARWETFTSIYEKLIEDKNSASDLLNFEDDKAILKKIPILDTLLEVERDSESSESIKEISLYEWISADSTTSLDEVYKKCFENIAKIEGNLVPALTKRIEYIFSEVELPIHREIHGLGPRLCGLDDLLRTITTLVEHQSDMAQSFIQNQTSAMQMKDTSILPDLCATHIQQLELIRGVHGQLIDLRNRVVKAKHEMSTSISNRIRWVKNVQDQIWDVDQWFRCLKEQIERLGKHIEVIQQIHVAPTMYMNAVTEVVRRRTFSQLYSMWASSLAYQIHTLVTEEETRRQDFNSQFEGHFLNALFPGMSDMPPSFATENPPLFDTKLPRLLKEDVDRLVTELPEFAESLVLPDLAMAITFFLGRHKGSDDKLDEAKCMDDKLIEAVRAAGLSSYLDKNFLKATSSESCLVTAPGLSNLKLDKGCESETDTDEFEKVGQSPLELVFPQGVDPEGAKTGGEKMDASTCTDLRNQIIPPKKPPRSFPADQRTLSVSTNEGSFTNIKNISLDSIDEMSSMKNFTDSCFNSHYNQYISSDTVSKALSRSKSVSPQSPCFYEGATSHTGAQQQQQPPTDFANEEFYIDESLPSSIGTGNSQGSEFVRQLDTANIVVAMLQDNLQISRSEHEKLKSTFQMLGSLAKLATSSLRTDLSHFREEFASQSQILSKQYEDLGSSWESIRFEVERNEKEIMESMTRERNEEKQRYIYNIMEKEDIIKRLEEDNRVVEDRIAHVAEQLTNLTKQSEMNAIKVEDLSNQLQSKDAEKERALKELADQLKLEHRAEIDNIKSRFKLMTMERSPSVSSLEKEKSGDFSSLPVHASLLVQMTENFELDKENAVLEERQRLGKVLEDAKKEWQKKSEEEKEQWGITVARRLSEDKDKLIDLLRDRERNLSLEVIKYKTTIQQLTECQEEDAELGESPDAMKQEIEELKNELARLKNVELSQSEIVTPVKVNVNSCKPGHVILVYWDQSHESFRVLQQASRSLFFVSRDSLLRLGLSLIQGNPNKTHCQAEVVSIELCVAKKDGNRYKIPKDTKFFLVKLKPLGVDLTQSEYAEAAELLEATEGDLIRVDLQEPQVVVPSYVENILTGDSGIVENVEQAIVAEEEEGDDDEEEERSGDYVSLPPGSSSEIEMRGATADPILESLQRENERLHAELAKVKRQSAPRLLSEGALRSSGEGISDASTSPLALSPPTSDMSRSEIVTSGQPRLSIDGCKAGDVVLVMWDQTHENFKILQESRHTFFLHSDCVERLGLSITDGKPNKNYCTAEVVDKEYCLTKKAENRYKVPKGAKFFRVRVKPVTCQLGQHHRDSKDMSQSAYISRMTASSSHSVSGAFESVPEEAAPTDQQIVLEESGVEEMPGIEENPSDRWCESGKEVVVVEQSTYVNTNWFEAMFRSMFSK